MAAVEKQGLAVVAFHAFHFAEEDGVIPGWVLTDYVTGKFGQRAVQQGNSGGGPAITDAQEGVLFRGLFGLGEILGKRLLPFAKNTDAKAALRFKKREKSGIVIHTDENKKRIQRNRSEGVGGHAVYHTRIALDGNHGNARGKRARHSAKHHGVERRNGHGAYFSR